MATSDERESARKRIAIHKRNLNALEEQAAQYGIDVPVHVRNQIDEERVKIASLEPIANPPAPNDTQVFVARVGDGNGGNWAMLFAQFVLLNTRMTKAEEQNQRILDEQARASLWRMNAGQDIEDLKQDQQAGERGRRRNLWLLTTTVTMLVVMAMLMGYLVAR